MTLTMADGFRWGYGRWGRRGGRPVLLHHGLIADRNLDPDWVEQADRAGIEAFVVERPGYGATPPLQMDRITDWPRLVAPLLTSLGLHGPIDVVGVSAGAPYALALAAGLPDRVRLACILSGVPFVNASEVISRYPEDKQATYAAFATLSDADLRSQMTALCQSLTGDADASEALTAILGHDCAGPAREARLQAVDWGFTRDDVRCPVHIWHSRGDDMVPFEAAEQSAAGLSKAVFHIQDAPSHQASETTLKELLAVLAA